MGATIIMSKWSNRYCSCYLPNNKLFSNSNAFEYFFGDNIYILNINNVHLATMLLYMYLLLKKKTIVKENHP